MRKQTTTQHQEGRTYAGFAGLMPPPPGVSVEEYERELEMLRADGYVPIRPAAPAPERHTYFAQSGYHDDGSRTIRFKVFRGGGPVEVARFYRPAKVWQATSHASRAERAVIEDYPALPGKYLAEELVKASNAAFAAGVTQCAAPG